MAWSVSDFKIEIDGVTYGAESIQSIHIEQPLFDSVSVGNACASCLNASVWLGENQDPSRQARVTPYICVTDDEVSPALENEWVAYGTYRIDTRSKDRNLLSLTCYDNMLLTEVNWYSIDKDWIDGQTFPMTYRDAVTRIASVLDINITATDFPTTLTIDAPVDENRTVREILQDMAGLMFSNIVVDRNGAFKVLTLFREDVPFYTFDDKAFYTFDDEAFYVDGDSLNQQYDCGYNATGFTADNYPKAFTGLQLENGGGGTWVQGNVTSDDANVFYINSHYAGQTIFDSQGQPVSEDEYSYGQQMANALWEQLQGNIYNGYTADGVLLNYKADLGDNVAFDIDFDGISEFRSFIANKSFDFTPLLVSDINAPYEAETIHEYENKGKTEKEVTKLQEAYNQLIRTDEGWEFFFSGGNIANDGTVATRLSKSVRIIDGMVIVGKGSSTDNNHYDFCGAFTDSGLLFFRDVDFSPDQNGHWTVGGVAPSNYFVVENSIAYFTGGDTPSLKVTNANIQLESTNNFMQLGQFAFRPRESGNLSFKIIGSV